MGRTATDYEAEIAALRAEVAKLELVRRADATGTFIAPRDHTLVPESARVAELTATISADGKLVSLDTGMAKLLGIPNRDYAIGTTLEAHDKGPLGKRFLSSVVELAVSAGQSQTVERAFADVPKYPPRTQNLGRINSSRLRNPSEGGRDTQGGGAKEDRS